MKNDSARVGVIRWDACIERTRFFGASTYRTLRPAEFRYRLPFYTRPVSNPAEGEPDFDFPDPATVADEESRYAYEAGVDYFAFCWYPKTPFLTADYGSDAGLATIAPYLYELNAARLAYESSEWTKKIHFCAIVGSCKLTDSDYAALAERMTLDCYEKVDGRPLVYIFGTTYEPDVIEKVRASAGAFGLDPFVVLMNGKGQSGVDAFGNYGLSVPPEGEDYVGRLSGRAEAVLDKRLGEGKTVCPSLTLGWNPLPRVVSPVVWCPYPDGGYRDMNEDAVMAQTRAVIEKIKTASDRVIPQFLFFAWDEFEEGGWICPTVALDENGNPDPALPPDCSHLNWFRKSASLIHASFD